MQYCIPAAVQDAVGDDRLGGASSGLHRRVVKPCRHPPAAQLGNGPLRRRGEILVRLELVC